MAVDDYLANKMAKDLIGKNLGSWHIEDYIDHGKSATVFQASRDNIKYALKVFDNEIAERYGRDKQKKRIEREQSLIGKQHPNLVSVYDGGEQDGYLFIVMEYFEGKNIAEALLDIPTSEYNSIIAQISFAAQYLEEISFAHRDIKPENIRISPDLKKVKLLDFGVVRPFDLSNITDEGEQLQFIGTLQYSPPELLFREMDDESVDAWRAISFYQIGAVIHDLLMKKPLFVEFKNPYARLVRAVEKEIPIIDNPSADPYLRLLAQNCLFKSPLHRLETVKWDDFRTTNITDPMDGARRRIAQHKAIALQVEERPSNYDDAVRTQLFALETQLISAVVSATKREHFPRYTTIVKKDNNSCLLRMVFEPSVKDGLNNYFVMYCKGVVVDPLANNQELHIWACVNLDCVSIANSPASGISNRSLKGAIIEQDIRKQVYESLLDFYAEALDTILSEEEMVKWF